MRILTKRLKIISGILVVSIVSGILIWVMHRQTETFTAVVTEQETLTYMKTMEEEVLTLAKTIDEERSMLQTATITRDDYESFADTLDPGFDTIESMYAEAHVKVLDTLNALYDLPTSGLMRRRIMVIDTYQEELTELFTYLLNYHYMTLEASMYLLDFNETTNEMTLYMTAGHITSVEYNASLEVLLSSYADLLNTNSLQVFDTERLENQDNRRELIERLENVKSEVTALHTMNEADQFVNEHIYTMFHLLEQSIRVLYDYADELNKITYSDAVNRRVEDGAYRFTTDYLEQLTDMEQYFENLEEQSVD